MARTHQYWKDTMTTNWMAKPEVIEKYGLVPGQTFAQQFSHVSITNILFDVIAFCAWTLDSLWDIFRIEADAEMAKQKVHTKEWYRQKALGFKFGVPILPGTDEFDVSGMDDGQVLAATVVNQAACVKLISSNGYGILRVKVATADGSGELQQLPDIQYQALKHYFLRNAVDAGTQVKITTSPADNLKLKLDIYYDPMVLSNTGSRLDNTNDTPVQDAITAFLRSIEFDGMMILSDLEVALRKIEGVKLATVKEAASKYGDYAYNTQGIANVGIIDEIRVADSGYMKIDELVINWRIIPE